jgi:HEAT repeat protein
MLLLLAALAVPLQAVEFSTAAPFNLPGLSRPAAARPVPAAAPAEAAPSASRAKWGRDALTYLKANSLSPDPEVRAAVAAAWGEIGNPRTLPLLRRAAKDRNDFVRVEAAVSLHKLGDEQGREVLLAVARSSAAPKGKLTPASEMKALSRTKARALALIKLSDLGGEDAVALMEQTLFDRSGAVRDATAVALCRLGLEEQFPRQFLGAAKDKDESVRAEAIKALGQTNLASVRATLVGAANDPAAAVRAEAVAALAAAKEIGRASCRERVS